MNAKVSELTSAGALDGSELVYVVQDGASRKVTLGALKAMITAWRGARLALTSTKTGLSSGYIVAWDTAVVDTTGFWAAGSPTRLTVPAGVSKVRLKWGVLAEELGSAGTILLRLRKNDAALASPDAYGLQSVRNTTTGYTTNAIHGQTPVLDVTAGDYFILEVIWSMAGMDQVRAAVETWFEIEVVE
jgi:hypothetical protein